MLREKHIKELREEFEIYERPLYFFHDDPDGATSFIQAFQNNEFGKGHIVKATPHLTAKQAKYSLEFGADAVFVFDIAMIDQEFVDAVKVPVIWLDHHDPIKLNKVKYFNPREWGENVPPCYMLYQVFEKNLWLSVVGCVGDWFFPPHFKKFKEKYSDLVGDEDYSLPEELMFNTKIGELVNMVSFNLKGTSREAMTSVKVLTRIEAPYEILDKSTSRGRYIFRKYERVKKEYDFLKKKALNSVKGDDNFFIYIYSDDRMAVTKDLANELSYLHPDKVIILAREKSGEMKTSLRTSRYGHPINEAVAKAVSNLPGSTGGGHEHACGANIKKQDWDAFIDNLRKALG